MESVTDVCIGKKMYKLAYGDLNSPVNGNVIRLMDSSQMEHQVPGTFQSRPATRSTFSLGNCESLRSSTGLWKRQWTNERASMLGTMFQLRSTRNFKKFSLLLFLFGFSHGRYILAYRYKPSNVCRFHRHIHPSQLSENFYFFIFIL